MTVCYLRTPTGKISPRRTSNRGDGAYRSASRQIMVCRVTPTRRTNSSCVISLRSRRYVEAVPMPVMLNWMSAWTRRQWRVECRRGERITLGAWCRPRPQGGATMGITGRAKRERVGELHPRLTLRLAARSLRHQPGSALAAVLTLEPCRLANLPPTVCALPPVPPEALGSRRITPNRILFQGDSRRHVTMSSPTTLVFYYTETAAWHPTRRSVR